VSVCALVVAVVGEPLPRELIAHRGAPGRLVSDRERFSLSPTAYASQVSSCARTTVSAMASNSSVDASVTRWAGTGWTRQRTAQVKPGKPSAGGTRGILPGA